MKFAITVEWTSPKSGATYSVDVDVTARVYADGIELEDVCISGAVPVSIGPRGFARWISGDAFRRGVDRVQQERIERQAFEQVMEAAA